MAKSKRPIPVILTDGQRWQLERLWFHYGNHGPEMTPGNHSFIQRLLENGFDARSLFIKRTPKYDRLTPECEAAVDAVLSKAAGLRVISSTGKPQRSESDPELKAMLDDINRRHRARHEVLESDGDVPDAA